MIGVLGIGGILCVLLSLGTAAASAQERDSASLKLSGSAQVSGDFHGSSGTAPGSARGRNDGSLLRLVLTPVLSYGEFSLPATIVLSSRQTVVTTPFAPDPSLTQYLLDPANHVSLSPKYGWAQAHLGTHTPHYSKLSVGYLPAFGAGLDLSPGNFRISGFAGVTQRAVEPDSTASVQGAYRRTMFAARLGFGEREKRSIDLIFIRTADDTTSIRGAPLGFEPPQEGSLASIAAFVGITPELSLNIEGAASLFTRDQRSRVYQGNDLDIAAPLMTIRESTRLDAATTATLSFSPGTWGFDLDLRYVGDGFVSPGYPYMPTDLAEATFSPRARFLQDRLILNGSLGYRTNNLSGTRLSTARQVQGTVNLFARITDLLNLSTGYSDFGLRYDGIGDIPSIRSANRSLYITPSLTIPGEILLHTLSATFSMNDHTADNAVGFLRNDARTRSAFGTWGVVLQRVPLNLTLTLSSIATTFTRGDLSILSVALGGGYRLMEGRLTPTLRLGYARNGFAGVTPDNNVTIRADAAWRLTETLTWTLGGSFSLYDYGSSRGDTSLAERFLRTAFTMNY